MLQNILFVKTEVLKIVQANTHIIAIKGKKKNLPDDKHHNNSKEIDALLTTTNKFGV